MEAWRSPWGPARSHRDGIPGEKSTSSVQAVSNGPREGQGGTGMHQTLCEGQNLSCCVVSAVPHPSAITPGLNSHGSCTQRQPKREKEGEII